MWDSDRKNVEENGLVTAGVAEKKTRKCITITIMDIIHRPVFYLKHEVSETGFFLRLQVGPIERAHLSRSLLKTETGLSPKRSVLNKRQDDR
jgi:hypothetical protein